ncbi:hypothetical protein [Planotetraspora kaengkrachanensis]|uniref:Uncharacterized protein n=1 Tax=Planotetraspora kaengkrachanensis TaxID=575193 RepID=A0A8J3PW98_9ACTN|nr:hypothetical protein [Planotetraspora kaengkrachanensis]GIG82245.1 hypothetical protein Pka01_53720 [Planotetraspora kaengkrachanensis]
MGVFYEYYRASDREAAVVRPDRSRVVANPSREVPAFDAVETKWVDPKVVLGRLVTFIGDVDFSLDLVGTVTLYPPPEGAPKSDKEWDALPEDSPYLEGPGIEELTVNVRDVLAGADDARLPLVAERWSKIEEFSHFSSVDGEYMLSLVRGLAGLARRAKASDQMLYCWSSL